MKTVSNTATTHVITFPVRFKEHLFNITYKLTLAHLRLLSAHGNFFYAVEMQSEAIYFKTIPLSKKVECQLALQPSHFLFCQIYLCFRYNNIRSFRNYLFVLSGELKF
jgi:hypothetical protein